MYILLKHVRYRIKPYRTVLDRERTVLVPKSIETIEENKNNHQKNILKQINQLFGITEILIIF